jgi:formylmethanofuran dehydrogenase subunit E
MAKKRRVALRCSGCGEPSMETGEALPSGWKKQGRLALCVACLQRRGKQ